MTILDRILLLATGLVAAYLIWRFQGDYQRHLHTYDLYYILSFAVLFVSGVLLILAGYGLLASPLVVIVAALIPLALAVGLWFQVYPKYGKAFLALAVMGFLALAVSLFTGPAALATLMLILVHSIAGLSIVFLPISAVNRKLAVPAFLWVSVGGALIGLGGIALAFLKTGSQFLFFSAEVVLAVLAPLLLLMTLAYTWGFVKQIRSAA